MPKAGYEAEFVAGHKGLAEALGVPKEELQGSLEMVLKSLRMSAEETNNPRLLLLGMAAYLLSVTYENWNPDGTKKGGPQNPLEFCIEALKLVDPIVKSWWSEWNGSRRR